MQQYSATCPKGFEQLLQNELVQLGAEVESETVGSVKFTASLETVYDICLWTRIANKILLPLDDKPVKTDQDLYDIVHRVSWEDHLNADGTLWIQFSGTNRFIRDTQFGARKAKDAIVDRLRNKFGQRPSIAKERPDLSVHLRLAKGRLAVAIDLTGESLHRRGYRLSQGTAPLKENLAAAILYRAGWPQIAQTQGALLDPMCGSGTLLIEAAMMAANMAPGLGRSDFAFVRWLGHQPELWAQCRQQAEDSQQLDNIGEIRGYDISRQVVDIAEQNIARAGLNRYVRVSVKPLGEFKKPTHKNINPGLIITNPPYGERLGEIQQLTQLYRQMGDRFKAEFTGWQAGVFTGNPDAGKFMGVRAHKKYKLNNGAIPAELLLFNLQPDQFVDAPPPDIILTAPNDPYKVTEGARMVMNRLQKNIKQLAKWQKNNNIECYRVYDADMPEYSAAIDVYDDFVHIQEYQAPKSVPEEKAQARFNDIVAAVKQVIQPDIDKISLKQRRRNKGKQQYQRAEETTGRHFVVREQGAEIEINLWDYLDTGLFLDHRPVRVFIQENARDKKFLNLFSYTATASVHAALGGARETVSVDMSRTYLEWAKRNFSLNNLRSAKHRFEQADCLEWLKQCREGFDFILLDPPTFSNSKRMQDTLDIQRDHVKLIKRCMDLLASDGTLIFSNNLRTFEIDAQSLARFEVTNFHQQSLDPDFQRNPKIHQCWLIRHTKSTT
jgi:23S rRNA (guanine2445-N2)-methyltransferase / 23S rRNA (guanine2069-N7)-methyltransferase